MTREDIERAMNLTPDAPRPGFGDDSSFPHLCCYTCEKDFIVLFRRDQDKEAQMDRYLEQHRGHNFIFNLGGAMTRDDIEKECDKTVYNDRVRRIMTDFALTWCGGPTMSVRE